MPGHGVGTNQCRRRWLRVSFVSTTVNAARCVYPNRASSCAVSDALAGRAGGAPIEAISASADAREPADGDTATLLFPSVGVTRGAEQMAVARRAGAPIHGMAGRATRTGTWKDRRSVVTGVLAPTTGIRVGFPFPFELRLRYALAGTALVFTAELANRGDGPFPYAFGLHPYLRAPLSDAAARGDWTVLLPGGTRLRSSDSSRTIERAPAAAGPWPYPIRSCRAR